MCPVREYSYNENYAELPLVFAKQNTLRLSCIRNSGVKSEFAEMLILKKLHLLFREDRCTIAVAEDFSVLFFPSLEHSVFAPDTQQFFHRK